MGEAIRRKRLKNPPKIRERSREEIAAVVIAYKNLFRTDPFMANLMLLCSELSEYFEIPINDADKLKIFIGENQAGLIMQYVKRFGSIDRNILEDAAGDNRQPHIPKLREIVNKVTRGLI